MKRFSLLFVVLVLITAGSSLAQSAPAGDSMVTYALNEDQTILTVELAGNAATGYEWHCALSPESLIALTSSEYVPDETSDAEMVGAGGKSVFVFEAAKKAAGLATLTFDYRRAWENEVLRSCEIDVRANEAGLLSVDGLRKSPPWLAGDFIDCPECGVEQAEVLEVLNGGEEAGAVLWGVILECPVCGRVEN